MIVVEYIERPGDQILSKKIAPSNDAVLTALGSFLHS